MTGGSTIEGAWCAARSRFATGPRPALQRCRAVRGLRRRTLRGRWRHRLMARWCDGDSRYGRRRDQWAADRRPADRSPSAHRRSRGAPPPPPRPGACRHPPRRRSGRCGGTPVTGPAWSCRRTRRRRRPTSASRCCRRTIRLLEVAFHEQWLSADPQDLPRRWHHTHLGVLLQYGRRMLEARTAARTRGTSYSAANATLPAAGVRIRWSHALSLQKSDFRPVESDFSP